MKFSTVTFGCKVNQYETQMMREMLGQFFEEADPGEQSDLVLINTCSVTAEADRQARQAMRRARRRNPGAQIIAAGCYARRPGVDLVKEGLADRVVEAPIAEALLSVLSDFTPVPPHPTLSPLRGEREKSSGEAHVRGEREKGEGGRQAGITRFDGHVRAFVKVQDGCDRRCSFCVIPLIRGNSASRSCSEIVEEIRGLAERGVPEVVLCGVRLNAYQDPETGGRLFALLKHVLEIPSLRRLRLSSLYPGKLELELLELIASHPKICKHLHLPIQSGSDPVLKAMRRGYTAADIRGPIRELRARCPEMALTADVLVGFPTEREEDVEITAELIVECGFHKLHLFPFSPRPGTPAESYPLLPPEVVAARQQRLAQLGSRLLADSLARQVGRETDVVVESRPRDGWWKGLTGSYHTVRFQSSKVQAGMVARVAITGVEGGSLLAVPVAGV